MTNTSRRNTIQKTLYWTTQAKGEHLCFGSVAVFDSLVTPVAILLFKVCANSWQKKGWRMFITANATYRSGKWYRYSVKDKTHDFFRNTCTKSGSLRFSVFRLLTDFVCLYTYEFWLSLCKIVRSSVILLLPLFSHECKLPKWWIHLNH